jgi:hypothetical protein
MVMNMKGKKFIKISDSCGKLDSATIESDADVKALMTRWKKKGLY